MLRAEVPVPIRIRRSALALFAERGFNATGIRDIAEAAAIPTSLLYHYRRSKEEILRDLIADGLARHLESSRRAVALARLPEEALRALVGVHVLVPLRNPDLARLMETEVRALSEASRTGVDALRAEGVARWEELLAWGARDGVFSFSDLHLARRLLLRMCTGTAHWFVPADDADADRLLGRLFDHTLAFLRANRDGRALRGIDVARPATADLRTVISAAHGDEAAVASQ